jgi:alkylhydroperoxidase family enzyme
MKGLQAESDWIWSGNLNPVPFPNNLARYFLQIPAIFEQQLNFSTTLIFDEPSFRNGIQMSGFVDRVHRELVISLIAQRRHCWYSMTHHAVLGFLTAKKHGLTDAEFSAKWSNLTEFARMPAVYSDVEREILQFADAFATNPKAYTDEQYGRLREALTRDNQARYANEGRWMDQLNAARSARSLALARGRTLEQANTDAAAASAAVSDAIPPEVNARKTDAQVVELAFLCMQFVALSDVFSGLNIPDESFLSDVMQNLLPDAVIATVNSLNELGPDQLPPLVPPSIADLPFQALLGNNIEVEPAPLKGARIPLRPYETNMANDLDKGLTVGGVQVGVYGWSFGYHFPGSLVYALMLHPELSRYEAPYSLPLLFNEDEWRNGTQIGGFVSRQLKELVYQKIYKTTRSRYGLEHHTMFLYNSYLDAAGVGRPPRPDLKPEEQEQARLAALNRAENATLYILNPNEAPVGTYTELEQAALAWTYRLLTQPHKAHEVESRLRQALDCQNRLEVGAGLRCLDSTPGIGTDAAFQRLLDHQIAELAMLIGHMDGLGRALTILKLESEEPVQIIEGHMNAQTQGIKPTLNQVGEAVPTGYFNNRPALLQILPAIGVSKRALTLNELLVNPKLCTDIQNQLKNGATLIRINSAVAKETGEF